MTGNDDPRRPRTDDELDHVQLAAMDAVWRARRHDGITGAEADRAETLIRTGRVAAARKVLTAAKHAAHGRRLAERGEPPEGGDAGGGDA